MDQSKYTRRCLQTLTLAMLSMSMPAVAVDIGMSLPFSEDWQSVQSTHSPQFTFQWENDAFLVGSISDRFYTNGLRMSYDFYGDDLFLKTADGNLTPMECKNKAGRIHLNQCDEFTEEMTNEAVKTQVYKVSKGVFISQDMFTPSDIRWGPDEIDQYERPYAGWAQVGFFTTQANSQNYERFEWSVGCVGSCSQADIAQENIHRNLGDQLPKGWGTQIKNAPTIQTKYERGMQLLSMPWSDRHIMKPYFVAELGNINIRSGLGMRLEFPIGNTSEEMAIERGQEQGQEKCSEHIKLSANQISSPLASLPAHSTYLSQLSTTQKNEQECDEVQYHIKNYITSREILFYVDVSTHLVAYNGLLQGPIGYDNDEQYLTTGHKPLLTTLSGGFQVKWHRVALDFSYHTRSTESDGEALAFSEHSWLGLKVSAPDTWFIGMPASLGFLWAGSKSGL